VEDLVIHKVAFTEESVFDYEHGIITRTYPAEENDTDWRLDDKNDIPLVRFPKGEIKEELEEYIQHHSRYKHSYYFRVRWFCEKLNRELMLFVKRGVRISIMQNWTVMGICTAADWTEDLEEDGHIRAWYETKITNLPDTDWVQEERIRKEMAEEERQKDEKERRRHERLFA